MAPVKVVRLMADAALSEPGRLLAWPLGPDTLDEFREAAVMRPLPVDAVAPAAPSELLEVVSCPRLEPVGDRILVNVLEQPVADRAPGERAKLPGEVEAAYDIDDLRVGIDVADEQAVGYRPALEQSSVTGKQDPPLGPRDSREHVVGPAEVVAGIEADQPEAAGQRSEVSVGDEPDLAERLGSHLGEIGDVEALEDGVDADPVAVAEAVSETDRSSVGQDEIDLRVRHPQRLERVLHRRRDNEPKRDIPLAPSERQEVVQLGIEANRRGARHHRPTGRRLNLTFTLGDIRPAFIVFHHLIDDKTSANPAIGRWRELAEDLADSDIGESNGSAGPSTPDTTRSSPRSATPPSPTQQPRASLQRSNT